MMWRLNGQAGIENSRKIIATHLVFMAIAVPIVSVLAYSVNYGFDETWYRYVISYYTAIVLFLVFSTIVKLQYRTLTYLGLISYSVYLFGPVVQAAVTLAMPRLAAGAFSEHLFILVVLVLTVGVASGVYHLVEVPSIALGKRLALRLIHRARVPTAVPFETPL